MLTYRHDGELWFAWKIVLLQYRKQLHYISFAIQWRCDLLEKSYFCSIANNKQHNRHGGFRVVICLKNRTFAVSQTTEFCTQEDVQGLWFAWKIVLLQYRKQPKHGALKKNWVVICLKNRTFAVSQTTHIRASVGFWVLWFAWKIVLLQYRKQPAVLFVLTGKRCDLLEKSYFCSIANNIPTDVDNLTFVVICLKNRTFAVSQTTRAFGKTTKTALWFAWKIVLLQYRKQQMPFRLCPHAGCDLLEKSYFCSIANNKLSIIIKFPVLWFAWKIVLLQYRKQRLGALIVSDIGCDLLEKSYFCSIANNPSF